MFAFRWKAAATAADKARALRDIRAFSGAIPGLLDVQAGSNFSERGQGYETGGVMRFADRRALTDYATHPLHQALLAWLLPLIEPVEIDFVADEAG